MDFNDRDDIGKDTQNENKSDLNSGSTEAADGVCKNTEGSSPGTDGSPDSWFENGRFYSRGDNYGPGSPPQGEDSNNPYGNRNNSPDWQTGGGIYNKNFQQDQPNGMATGAMILGIISLVTSCCFYLAIPLGVIGIILAVLSQGSERSLSPRAKSGLWLAGAGAALSLFLTVASVAITFSRYGTDGFMDMFKQYQQFYEGQIPEDGGTGNNNDMKNWMDEYLNGKNSSRNLKIEEQDSNL